MPNIEEIIRKAIQEGAFENLRGTGKPLNIEDNPYVDPSWQLAYHLLKENGFALSFIEMRQGIDLEHAAARQALTLAWEWRLAALSEEQDARWVESQWTKAVAAFAETADALNKRIFNYNLQSPAEFHRHRIDVKSELLRLTKNEG